MDYKTIFIVDPIKSDRIQLAKFIKQENFTVMGFVGLQQAFKQKNLQSHLIIYVLRTGKSDLKALRKVGRKDRAIPCIVVSGEDTPEVNLGELEELGFQSVFKAANPEKVREITYGLLAPDGLAPRTETPHPVPIPRTTTDYLETLRNEPEHTPQS